MPSATALSLALPRLSALRCHVGRVTDSLLAAVLALPCLERLALEAPRMHPLAGATAALVTALQELRLCSSQLPGNLCDQLAALQRLTRLVRRLGLGLGSCSCGVIEVGWQHTLPASSTGAPDVRGA